VFVFAEKLPWYHVINWLLFAVASTSAFEITIFYAVLIAPGRSLEENLNPTTFHIHVINSVLLLIDIFMVAFPTRFLHFIYTMIYGVLYTLFLLILHLTNYNSAVYTQLNFAESPGTTAMWLVIAVIVLPLGLHSIIFGLYHLRVFIARKTVQDTSARREKHEMGASNPTFHDEKNV